MTEHETTVVELLRENNRLLHEQNGLLREGVPAGALVPLRSIADLVSGELGKQVSRTSRRACQ